MVDWSDPYWLAFVVFSFWGRELAMGRATEQAVGWHSCVHTHELLPPDCCCACDECRKAHQTS